jgi:dihydropteroate synthase
MAVERGAHVIRTHDVAETRDAALIGAEFAEDRVREAGDIAIEELDVTTPREAERHLDRVGASDVTGSDAVDPGTVSGDAVINVFELDGLPDGDVDTLSAAATDAGVTVVPGATAGSGGRSVLVFGTPRALAELSVGAAASDALEAAVAAVR